jgi:hypothetical protein
MIICAPERWALVALAMLCVSCAPAPPPAAAPAVDPTTESWYGEATTQLASAAKEARSLMDAGKFDAAGAAITNAQPLLNRVLAAPHPTLAAMEAASDLDDLYARMLLRNGQYGWARSFFQKNAARWKSWKPETPETIRRRQEAVAGLAETDRRMAQ